MNESQFSFLSETEAVQPSKGRYFQRIEDSWWIVHSTKGLVFFSPGRLQSYAAPQCNPSKTIVQKIAENIKYSFEYEVKHFEIAWVPVDPRSFK